MENTMHITAALEGIFGSTPPDPQPGMIYYTVNVEDMNVDFYKIIARSDDEVTVRRLNDRQGPNGFFPVGDVFGASIRARLGKPKPNLFMVEGFAVLFWDNRPVLL